MSNQHNPYLSGTIGKVFVKTAIPIIIIMLVNGLYGIVDAYFLGVYVGEEALSAVTFTFPIQMMLFALTTLFANGMASVVARAIGAGEIGFARRVFTSAHYISVSVFLMICLLYLLGGIEFVAVIVGDFPDLIQLSDQYIKILVYCSPVMAVLAINIDALRSEGKLEMMSGVMLLSAILNVVFDYIFIAELKLGVKASAYATVLSQIVSLCLILQYRLRGKALLSYSSDGFNKIADIAKEIVPLGIPSSLAYVGIALTVGVINYNVSLWAPAEYASIVAAHGIVTRIMTLAMLPLIGMTVAFQSILGNNFGAKLYDRSNDIISLGLKVSLAYCCCVQAAFFVSAKLSVGFVFVEDELVAEQVSRLLLLLSLGFFSVGPIAILASKFQAIGEAKNAILLGLSKSYLFMIPLVFMLPYTIGEIGIWISAPVSDALIVTLAFWILMKNARRENISRGLFFKGAV